MQRVVSILSSENSFLTSIYFSKKGNGYRSVSVKTSKSLLSWIPPHPRALARTHNPSTVTVSSSELGRFMNKQSTLDSDMSELKGEFTFKLVLCKSPKNLKTMAGKPGEVCGHPPQHTRMVSEKTKTPYSIENSRI